MEKGVVTMSYANYIHEDELPDLTQEEYNELYKTSYILDIVRVFVKKDVEETIKKRYL
jgi:hypothetical protein